MIDSIYIISKGGLILHEQNPNDPSATAQNGHIESVNVFISSVLLDPTKVPSTKRSVLPNKTVAEWKDSKDCFVLALYPEVLLRSSKSVDWIQLLLANIIQEYNIFASSFQEDSIIPNTSLFNKTLVLLYKQAIKQKDHIVTQQNDLRQSGKRTTIKTNRSGKEKRIWGEQKVTKQAMAELDYSNPQQAVPDDTRALAEARAAYLPDADEIPLWEEQEILDDAEDSHSSWGSSVRGLFDQMAGNKVLTAKDLDHPIQEMQKHLTSKNVANDIAADICNSVKGKLIGKRMQSFSRVKTAVRQALEAAIAKLLQPAKSKQVDLLRGVVTKREAGFFSKSASQKHPFVIVMIGINGVGKSTSLAKLAYYLKSNGCSPLLAACDTFRSGAVEQLNVHAKTLELPLYHKGYAKDPSAVAKAAINQATQEGRDVVLVDTAGRMQNNVPLMKALSKLVVENNPDLVLFVCEALVGNDGIDQLNMFNKALRQGGHVRQIDGIILTKFDTVSDKVGAALTLTHVTGAPVVFVGTGQKYTHLKKLSSQTIIKSLFR